MSEICEEGTPQQEKGGEIQAPEVSRHLSFLSEATWQYQDLSPERQRDINHSFEIAFKKLPPYEQKAISLEVEALGVEIEALDKQNKGIAIVRQSRIVSRIEEIMDRSGVVASANANEGGVERAKNALVDIAKKMAEYLAEYDIFAKSIKGKTAKRQAAEYLLAISSGIKEELKRLQLVDIASATPQGEVQKELRSRHILNTSILDFWKALHNAIGTEKLFGFSTLINLIEEFHHAKKYLTEES